MDYIELHCHSNFSFQEGASFPHELLEQAKILGYKGLGLTDHNNLTAALDFSKMAKSMGIHPIIGSEITLEGGYHITVLAENKRGYSNLSNLISESYRFSEHNNPELNFELFRQYSEGLIILTGCLKGEIPTLLMQGKSLEAQIKTLEYLEIFGDENVFFEIQNNLVYGDMKRNRLLLNLALKNNIPTVATNNVHYHIQDRHKINDILVSINNDSNLDSGHKFHRPNDQYYLKSKAEMEKLFSFSISSLNNTIQIAERCNFDIVKDVIYTFPDYEVPDGFDSDSYLLDICEKAVMDKYGSMTTKIKDRLNEELRRIKKHNLAGFFLIYYEIIQLARNINEELIVKSNLPPVLKNSPGRGRGSSVAMLVGFLIGLSHIDPLNYDLGLDRFLPEKLNNIPDIDLDFPRNIREELIKRIHSKYGWKYSALVGAINTYQMKSALLAVGKAFNVPHSSLKNIMNKLDKKSIGTVLRNTIDDQRSLDIIPFSQLVKIANEIVGFPKYLQQHSGGMVISSNPLSEVVPIVPGIQKGRYMMQWDKDAIHLMGMVKIDFLALGTLSQMQEIVNEIYVRHAVIIDVARINFCDEEVYDSIGKADTIGVFQIESAAQMQTSPRLKPRNLDDMAYQVASVRPGVGVGNGVRNFIDRRNGKSWEFDHILEKPVLGHTLGIILYQDQVNDIAVHVAGFDTDEADQMRRDLGKNNNSLVINKWHDKFLIGAIDQGVPSDTANMIFNKLTGEYMFPEAHAYAFGVTAYQMAWLKFYYPLEFYMALINQQPMGFWPIETIKEDAIRHKVIIKNPDINFSFNKAIIDKDKILLGFSFIRNIGITDIDKILEEKNKRGLFIDLSDFMYRISLSKRALFSMVDSGVFDSFNTNMRMMKWEIGLRKRVDDKHYSMSFPIENEFPYLPHQNKTEILLGENNSLGFSPSGHIVGELRKSIFSDLQNKSDLHKLKNGDHIVIAGLIVRRQKPKSSKNYFVTLEDEYGHIPLIVTAEIWEVNRLIFQDDFVLVGGHLSLYDGVFNIIVDSVVSVQKYVDGQYITNAMDWR